VCLQFEKQRTSTNTPFWGG